MNLHSALLLAFFVALAAAPASAQFGVLYLWPDSSYPCNGTLQACVSAAGPDDGVEIATNGPIDESIDKTGSLDLRAALGFSPVFAANRQITARPSLAGGDQFIRIAGLTLTRGQIQVSQVGQPAALTVQLFDNTVLAPQASPPIQVVAWDSGGPLVFTISGNTLATDISWDAVVLVSVVRAFASGDIVANVIPVPPNNDAVAIDLSVEDGALDVDVVGNRIDGAFYHDGIVLNRSGTGVLTARILGNLVRGASGGAGIAAYGNGTPDGNLDVQIVNNTVTGNWRGIQVFAIDSIVANNVITHSVDSGLSGAVPANHHNLFFGNAEDFDASTAGPGSVFADPLFVGANDFRLRAGSPAIDAGDSTAVPPELTTDLAANPRIAGAAVDIGAYEAPEPPGTLASIIAVLALASRARRRRLRTGSARHQRSELPSATSTAATGRPIARCRTW